MSPEIFNARVAQYKKAQKTRGRHQARRIIPNTMNQEAQQADQDQQIQDSEQQINENQQSTNTQMYEQDNMPLDQDTQPYSDSLNPVHPHKSPNEYSEVLRSEVPATSPWKPFAPKPLHVFFDSQHASEEILLLLRMHPLVLLPKILGSVLFAIFPFFISTLGLFATVPLNYVFATYILWYLLLAGFLLETFLTWFFHVFIITDERIIDVDFISLIYKRITAAKIDNIEDVSTITGGAIRSVFDFGTVKIQTASANAQIAFEDVPSPAKVKRLLNELILEEEREKIEGRIN